ncbi:MAG: right-handed parallel beta-helix repeat-containing protein, partial [Syntrophobacteraceae bacterium]|nr:right-handed parallel beta-helix repeat-containing protein [Syntrophobacteraceae bacterium]
IGGTNPGGAAFFDSSGNFNLPGGIETPGPVSIGTNYLTANTLAQLTAAASFAGTVYLTAPVALAGNLTLTCDLRPVQGAVITTTGYTLTLPVPICNRFQIFAGTGTVTFSNGGTVYPEWFGAKGDDTTDDYAAIQAAGAALSTGGGTLQGDRTKSYKCGTGLVFQGISNLMLKDLTLDCSGLAAHGTAIIVAGATTSTTTTLTGPLDSTNTFVPRSTLTINVANSAGFAAGDMITFRSTQPWIPGYANYVAGELGFVASVGTGTITLVSGLRTDYTISVASGYVVTISKISQINNPVVDNVRITGSGTGQDQTGIYVKYASHPLIKHCYVNHCDTEGLDFLCCDNGLMDDNEIYNCADTTHPAGYPFIFDNFSTDCTVQNSKAVNFRNGFSIASYVPTWNWSVIHNTFTNALTPVLGGEAINTHPSGINGIVAYNHIENMSEGIYLMSAHNLVIGNTVRNIWTLSGSGVGIQVTDWSAPNQNMKTKIVDNYVVGVRGIVALSADGTSYGVDIENNTVEGMTVNGIAPDYGIDVNTPQSSIQGNRITGFPTPIYTPGYTTSSTVPPIVIANNVINGARQDYGVLDSSVGAGLTNATNSGYVKSANAATLVLNGTFYNWTAHDNYWNLTAVATDSTHFRKVAIALNQMHSPQILVGNPEISQALAVLPQIPYNYSLLGWVEIPNSYAGGSLAGYAFHNIVGAFQQVPSGYSGCAGFVSLSSGVATVSNSCITGSKPVACGDQTSGLAVTCTPSAGSLSVTGTGSDIISWVQNNQVP